MTQDESAGDEAEATGAVTRPREVIQFLSPQHQWEITRRHPYYLLFWEYARRHRTVPSTDELQHNVDAACTAFLTAINVSGVPVDPAISFAELNAEFPLPRTWSDGAFSQMSFRGLVGCFLFLPPEMRQAVAQLLIESLRVDPNDPVGRVALAERVHRLPAEFDTFPEAPLVSLNLHAPQRAILAAVTEYVRSEKQRRGIPERRRREESISDFLEVWDQREGWTGSGYDGEGEHSLLEIAQRRRLSIETIRNRYNSAFRLIVGHEYSPELWDRLFGRVKVAGLFGDTLPSWRSLHRPTRSRVQQPVPISRVFGDAGDAVAANYSQANDLANGDLDVANLLAQIRHLIAAGASNTEIVATLELRTSDAEELIEAIRSRSQDSL